MSDALTRALSNPGPHTAESLAAVLPDFPIEGIRQALEMLTAQGVLERDNTAKGEPAYRYVRPDLYAQANLDVIQNPGDRHNPKRR